MGWGLARNHALCGLLRDDAHQTTDTHQVLLHHLLYYSLDGLYSQITYESEGNSSLSLKEGLDADFDADANYADADSD